MQIVKKISEIKEILSDLEKNNSNLYIDSSWVDLKTIAGEATSSFKYDPNDDSILRLDKIKLDIEELKNRETGSNDSVSSNERILNQIKVLSEMKKDGILTNSEFNDKKKLLLDKLK